MWGNYLYFVTPDDYFVSLDARTGKERWHKEIAPFSQQYFLTSAPIDRRQPHHRRHRQRSRLARLPAVVRSGNRRRSSGGSTRVPMNPGDPGLETWKSLDAARHGGGHPWLPGVYDPETHLYIFGTGNPTPAYTSAPRGEGWTTCSPARSSRCNVDTGKMAWYYQTSPHDTHDWDSAQTPVLVDGDVQRQRPAQDGADRQPQRLLLHARSPHRRAHGDQHSSPTP